MSSEDDGQVPVTMRTSTDVMVELVAEVGANVVTPGSSLKFVVYILINRKIKVSSLTVTFVSAGHCTRRNEALFALFASPITTEPYGGTANFPYVTRRETFCTTTVNMAEIFADSGNELSRVLVAQKPTLTPYLGKFYSQFSSTAWIQLPEDIPDSWRYPQNDISAGVINTLITSIKYTTFPSTQEQPEKEVTGQTELNVKSLVWVERLSDDEHAPAEHTVERMVRGCWLGSQGQIRCRLGVGDKLGLLGHSFPVVVEINNGSSKTIHKVSVTLYKEYTFQDKTVSPQRVPVTTRREKMFSVPLPRVEPGIVWKKQIPWLIIPNNCVTSGGLQRFSFVHVRYFFRLYVKWCAGSIKCDVDIFLGTRHDKPFLRLPADIPVFQKDTVV